MLIKMKWLEVLQKDKVAGRRIVSPCRGSSGESISSATESNEIIAVEARFYPKTV